MEDFSKLLSSIVSFLWFIGVVVLVFLLWDVLKSLITRLEEYVKNLRFEIKDGNVNLSGEAEPDDEGPMDDSFVAPNITNAQAVELEGQEIGRILIDSERESLERDFVFANQLERSFRSDTKKRVRQIRFRIGLREGLERAIDIKIRAYLVTTKKFDYHNNHGWGSNWAELEINKTYLPHMDGYWSISHRLDSTSNPSPFLTQVSDKSVIARTIRVYALGRSLNGEMLFGMKTYKWDRANAIYGSAKLRAIGQFKLTEEEFNQIEPEKEKGEWPFLE
jgi:hypothetical protein